VNNGVTIYGDFNQNTSIDGGATMYLNNVTSSGVLGGSSLGGTSNAAYWASNAAYYASNAAGAVTSNAGFLGLYPVFTQYLSLFTSVTLSGSGITTVYDNYQPGHGTVPSPMCYNGCFLFGHSSSEATGLCSNARFLLRGYVRGTGSGSYSSQLGIWYSSNNFSTWNYVNTVGYDDGSEGGFWWNSFGASNGPTTITTPWFQVPMVGTNEPGWIGISVNDSPTQTSGIFLTSTHIQVA
jgi:hypothetical protein